MTIYLKQSTASQEIPIGVFVDETDGHTAETGLTIANTDIKLWAAGATTLADKNSGGATHISGGIYYAVLDATDTATLGSLKAFVHVSGALPCMVECVVLAANIFDSLIAGTDLFDVSVTQFGGSNITAAAGIPEVKVASLAANSITAAATANDFLAEVNAEVVDCLNVDTYAEPTGAPAATASLASKIGRLHQALRNKMTVTGSSKAFFDDAGASLWSKGVSDNGTTYTEAEGS